MGDDSPNIDARAAETMLEAFNSVGAERFDLTLTDLEGEKLRFRKGLKSPSCNASSPACWPMPSPGSTTSSSARTPRPSRSFSSTTWQARPLSASSRRLPHSRNQPRESSGLGRRRHRRGRRLCPQASQRHRGRPDRLRLHPHRGQPQFQAQIRPAFPARGDPSPRPPPCFSRRRAAGPRPGGRTRACRAAPVRVSRPRRGRAWPSYKSAAWRARR